MTTKLKSRFAEMYNELAREGKAYTINAEVCAQFDMQVAQKMEEIKSDFEQRERASRVAVAKLELRSILK
jgi:hypothetical protein